MSLTNFPKVFIIILNHNGAECLLKTLASVFKITYRNFEVVLVDNGSEDRSFEMARSAFSRIIFIKNSQNLGFSAGNNVGIKYALERGADFILLLNYDTEVQSNFLSILVEKMNDDERIGLSSPVILDSNCKIFFSGGKIDWFRMRAYNLKSEIKRDNYNSHYICGCSMLIRADVFKIIGLLDEKYFLYYEDTDFSLRARKAGYKLLVCPMSRMVHLEKSELDKNKKTYWLVLSALFFFAENAPFWLKPWILFFARIRRLKNNLDIKKEKTSVALSVQKAYQDFFYVK